MRLGIIDIGSNSIRLVINEVKDKSFHTMNQIKHSVRLAHNMDSTGSISEEKMQLALNTLRYFRNYASFYNVNELIVIATEAVRRANNQNDFLKRANRILRTDIRVLSGSEECYYDYLATVNTIDIKNALAFDLGGASTELMLIQDRKLTESISLPFGALNLTEKFSLNDGVTQEKLDALKNFIFEKLKEVSWLKRSVGLNLVGIGGSSRTLGKIDRYMKKQSSFIAHNYSVSKHDISKINQISKKYWLNKGNRIPGLSKDREDIFLASLTVISVLSDFIKTNRLFVSGAGVRDGILYEYLLGANRLVNDVLENSINNIIHQHMDKNYNGEQVWKISERLFNQLSKNDLAMKAGRKSLKVASYLYDLGSNINHYQKDRNTFYSILNAPINGLNQKQILIAASIASLYNSDDILKDYLNKKILSESDIRVIEKLGLLLKLAIALSYGYIDNLNIEEIHLHNDDELVIKVDSLDKLLFIDEDLSHFSHHFKRVFKRDIIITDS